MQVRRRSRPMAPPPRRRLIWATANVSGVAALDTTPIISNLLAPVETALGANLIGITVTRIVGWLYLFPDPAGTQIVDWGIRKGTSVEDAVDLDPTDDSFQDWMAYGRLLQAPSTLGNTSPGPGFQRIDIRSQRKIDEVNETLYVAFGSPSATVANFQSHFRILVKLP